MTRQIRRTVLFGLVSIMCLLGVQNASADPVNCGPPVVQPGQGDGLFISLDNGTICINAHLSEGKGESFFTSFTPNALPPNFHDQTIFLAESGPPCAPAFTNLGSCSDGLIIKKNTTDNSLSIFFISDGASAAAMRTFFSNLTAHPIQDAETGKYRDVSGDFGLSTGTVLVQSDVPEPPSRLLLGVGLGLLAILWLPGWRRSKICD